MCGAANRVAIGKDPKQCGASPNANFGGIGMQDSVHTTASARGLTSQGFAAERRNGRDLRVEQVRTGEPS